MGVGNSLSHPVDVNEAAGAHLRSRLDNDWSAQIFKREYVVFGGI